MTRPTAASTQGSVCGLSLRIVHAVALVAAAMLFNASAEAANPLQSTMTATNALTAQRSAAAEKTDAAPDAPSADELAPLSDSELQGYGCLTAGTAATGMAWLAGSDHLIMVVAGGTLAPVNPVGAAVAITGTIFASICAVGALATPAVIRLWDIYYNGKKPRS